MKDCHVLGLQGKSSLRSTFSLRVMHRAAKLDKVSLISDGFQRHPQTRSSPPPQRKVIGGTKGSAMCIGPFSGLRPLVVSRLKLGGSLLQHQKRDFRAYISRKSLFDTSLL